MRLEDPEPNNYSSLDLDVDEYLDTLPDLDGSYSKDLNDLLREMLRADPDTRKLTYTSRSHGGAVVFFHPVRTVLGMGKHQAHPFITVVFSLHP